MELQKIDAVAPYIADEPWSMYWAEFKSGTQEFEDFLHNPLEFYVENIEEVDDSWSIQTDILCHEHGIVESAVCKITFVLPKYKLVKATLYKHDPVTNA